MLVLYITYVDFNHAVSGSAVRPEKMYRAFLEEGHEVKLLTGSQERRCREQRRAAVAEISAWLDTNRPDLCYIESPVQPILWSFDRRLIRKIHRKGIPIGYFYRDYYRKFPDLFPRRRDPAGRCKELWLNILQRRLDRLLRCADVVYFPSRQAMEMFSFPRMEMLPPAGERRENLSEPEGNTCIYVGGLTNHYGGEMLLRAFSILNEGTERFPLILVCREAEWRKMPSEYASKPWLEVRHASGEELIPLYARAAAGLIADRLPNRYNDLAHSVKLFEYMSEGLPVVYVHSAATDEFVRPLGFGIGTDFDPEKFAAGVRAMFADPAAYRARREAALRALREGNCWFHRVRQVIRDLTEGEHP